MTAYTESPRLGQQAGRRRRLLGRVRHVADLAGRRLRSAAPTCRASSTRSSRRCSALVLVRHDLVVGLGPGRSRARSRRQPDGADLGQRQCRTRSGSLPRPIRWSRSSAAATCRSDATQAAISSATSARQPGARRPDEHGGGRRRHAIGDLQRQRQHGDADLAAVDPVGRLDGVDAYALSTQVSSLQTQIQASYELTAQLQQMSLVNYLA